MSGNVEEGRGKEKRGDRKDEEVYLLRAGLQLRLKHLISEMKFAFSIKKEGG